MNHDYSDIRGRIAEEPAWLDENAVPRYGEFSPDAVADIYATEVVLALITCQGCGREFRVAFSASSVVCGPRCLADEISAKALHYGDPPNIGCCASGPTMNSEPRRVIEYWRRHHREFTKKQESLRVVTNVARYMEWRRDQDLEIEIVPDWVFR